MHTVEIRQDAIDRLGAALASAETERDTARAELEVERKEIAHVRQVERASTRIAGRATTSAKRFEAELEEIREWTKVQADRTALAEKNDLISRGGWQKANAELEAARAENTNLLAELAVPKSPTGQVYVSECTRLHREVERLGWKVDEQAGEMLAAKQSTERAEAELAHVDEVLARRPAVSGESDRCRKIEMAFAAASRGEKAEAKLDEKRAGWWKQCEKGDSND